MKGLSPFFLLAGPSYLHPPLLSVVSKRKIGVNFRHFTLFNSGSTNSGSTWLSTYSGSTNSGSTYSTYSGSTSLALLTLALPALDLPTLLYSTLFVCIWCEKIPSLPGETWPDWGAGLGAGGLARGRVSPLRAANLPASLLGRKGRMPKIGESPKKALVEATGARWPASEAGDPICRPAVRWTSRSLEVDDAARRSSTGTNASRASRPSTS